jgi:hypothetical protein
MKRLRIAGDRTVKTTVEQTLIRGLVTAFPLFVRGCLDLPAGVDEESSATQFIRGFPTEALSPALRNSGCQFTLSWPSVIDVSSFDSMRQNAARLRGQLPTGKPPSHARLRS